MNGGMVIILHKSIVIYYETEIKNTEMLKKLRWFIINIHLSLVTKESFKVYNSNETKSQAKKTSVI